MDRSHRRFARHGQAARPAWFGAAVLDPRGLPAAHVVLDDQKLASIVLEGGRLRATLLELWQRTRIDWGFVTDRLSTTFRKETWIGAHERRFLSETLYGLVRHLRRIDAALDRGRKVKKSPRDIERVLAYFVLEKLIDP